MSRKKALLAALILVAALAGLALVTPFDAPGLGREVSERVRTATGIELRIARSRLRLLRGLLLENVRATAGSYDIRASRLTLEPRPFSLLTARPEVKGVGLEDVQIGSVSIAALRLDLPRFDYDPRALTAIHGLSLEGILDMRDVAFDGRKLSSLAARVTTQNGRFELDRLELLGGGGELSGDASFDFNTIPFRYRVSLFGPSFEVEGVGRGKLRLEAEGFGTKLRSLKGKGP
ncbi:MAG TPA: hypothetical protein VIE88_08665, partial [Vicinamibacteria bacterium]